MADSEPLSKLISTHYPPWIFLLILTSGIHGGCAIWYANVPEDDRFSYTVAITISGRETCSFCSGAIISPQHILTAAHCCYCADDPSRYEILVLDIDDPTESELYSVESIHLHPEYEHGGDKFEYCKKLLTVCILNRLPNLRGKNDIAVLKLHKYLSLGSIRKVNLPLPAPFNYPTACNFSSFGGTETKLQTGEFSPGFRWAQLTIIDPEECQQKLVHSITDNILCTEDKRSRIANGDSGGPLACNGAIYGVLSVGLPRTDRPAVFTDVAHYLKFIFAVIKKG